MSKPVWSKVAGLTLIEDRTHHNPAWVYPYSNDQHACVAKSKTTGMWEVRYDPTVPVFWRNEPVKAEFDTLEEAKAYAEVMAKLEAA